MVRVRYCAQLLKLIHIKWYNNEVNILQIHNRIHIHIISRNVNTLVAFVAHFIPFLIVLQLIIVSISIWLHYIWWWMFIFGGSQHAFAKMPFIRSFFKMTKKGTENLQYSTATTTIISIQWTVILFMKRRSIRHDSWIYGSNIFRSMVHSQIQ